MALFWLSTYSLASPTKIYFGEMTRNSIHPIHFRLQKKVKKNLEDLIDIFF